MALLNAYALTETSENDPHSRQGINGLIFIIKSSCTDKFKQNKF